MAPRRSSPRFQSPCLWTLSGLLLAACGGGGGGGGGGLTTVTATTTTAPVSLTGTAATGGDDIPDPNGEHVVIFESLDDDDALPPQPLITLPSTVTPPPPPGPPRVIVTMGPISDARVWVDVNADGVLDTGDGDLPVGFTDTHGSIEIASTHRGSNLIARMGEETTGRTAVYQPLYPLPPEDFFTFDNEWRALDTDSDEIVISPITDYLARHADTDKQAVLDSIFGNTGDAVRRITLDDVLDADNYLPNTAGVKALVIKSLAYALYGLADHDTDEDDPMGNTDDPVDPTLGEKIRGLFAPYRDENREDGPFLAGGTLAEFVIELLASSFSMPVILRAPHDPPLLTGREDTAIKFAESLPDLLNIDDKGLDAAEHFFGFEDPLGQIVRTPGMTGIYLEDYFGSINVPFAGGDAEKSIRIFVTGDDGRIFPIGSTDAARYLGTDSISNLMGGIPEKYAGYTIGDGPEHHTFVSWDNLHRLVFAPEADAHGTFEIDYRVSDGEFYSGTVGTVLVKIAPVDDPARITIDLPALTSTGGNTPDAYLDPDGEIMLAGTSSGLVSVADIEDPASAFTLTIGTPGDSGLFTLDTDDPKGAALRLADDATAKAAGASYHVNIIASIDGEVAAEETYHFIQAAEDFTLPVDII